MSDINLDTHTLIQLSTRINAGDRKAFETVFHTYYPLLYKYACILLNNPTVSDDIIQDVFLNLWVNRKNIKPETPLINYLTIAVKNSCYNALKKKKADPNIDINNIHICMEPSESSESLYLDNPEYVWQAINSLPNKCKHIFKLIALEHCKYKDVADQLNVSVNTVKTQMKIAYKLLREKLVTTTEVMEN